MNARSDEPRDEQILLKVSETMNARITKAAAAKGVTRQAFIAGVLDDLLPKSSAARKAFDIPFPGFPT